MSNLLSVIVPVYNNASYLRQTLASILHQSYADIELLLVDDGSTDESLSICEEAAKKDSRITIIKKENGGVSSARNCGLDRAHGEYIAFVDSDDCLDVEMYKEMLSVMKKEKADIVNCRVIKEGSFSPIPYTTCDILVSENPWDCLSKKGHFIDSSLNKVYARDLIGNTRFDENISYSEDKLFVTEILLKATRMALMDHIFYHYIQHKDSLSWKDTYEVWEGNFQVNKQIYDWIRARNDITPNIKSSVFRGYVKSIIALLRYDVKYRKEKKYKETLELYHDDLCRFMKETSLSFSKRLEYKTYISSYFLASIVHYYFKRKK